MSSDQRSELGLALCSPGAAVVLLYCVACFFATTAKCTVHWRPLPGERIAATGSGGGGDDGDGTVFIKDAEVDKPFEEETVPFFPHLVAICYVPPLFLFLLGRCFSKARGDARAALYGFASAMATTELFNTAIKNYVGRMRPLFYQKCGFDAATAQCADDEELLRQSFPSGHSSASMCSMLFCTLFLLGKLRLRRSLVTRPLAEPPSSSSSSSSSSSEGAEARNSGAPLVAVGGLHCAPALAAAATAPVWVAVWVACTRVHDNWHHPSDIVAGSLLGAAIASFFYSLGFPSVFADDSHLPLVSPSRAFFGAFPAGAGGAPTTSMGEQKALLFRPQPSGRSGAGGTQPPAGASSYLAIARP